MTNEQVSNGFAEVYNEFWCRYKDRQPKEGSPEWERMHTWAVVLKKKYPLMEEAISRMTSEIIERARGRGRIPGDYHRPPT